jgi:hypothetical protein
MCQSTREGGRRCPIHQNANRAAIKAAAEVSGLTVKQTERLFAELRREGRHASTFSEYERGLSYDMIRAAAKDTNNETDIKNLLDRAGNELANDGASDYAQYRIVERAEARATAMNTRFEKVAERTGYSVPEIQAKFEEIYNDVVIVRGQEHPSEYNQNTRRHAAQANLPYDVQSVVALERLNNLEKKEETRRVSLIPVPRSRFLHSYGYDEGRLEVTFQNNPEQVFAYHNVPEGVWEDLRVGTNPGSYYSRNIRGNNEYTYETAEEAEQDAFRLRCESCGQFRAAAHICPEGVTRDEIVATGATVRNWEEILAEAIAREYGSDSVVDESPVVETEVNQISQSVDKEGVIEETTFDAIVSRFEACEGLDHILLDNPTTRDIAAEMVENGYRLTPSELNRFYEDKEKEEAEPVTDETVVEENTAEVVSNVPKIIVPLPEIEANNSWVDTESEIVDVKRDELVALYGDKAIVADEETFAKKFDYVPTAENQRIPEAFDAKTEFLVSSTPVNYSSLVSLDSDAIKSSSTNYEAEFSKEEYELIKNAPVHANFLINRESVGGYNFETHSYTYASNIVKVYDSRIYQHLIQYGNRGYNDEFRNDLKIYKKPKYAPILEATEKDYATEIAKVNKLVEEGKATKVDMTSTLSRKYVFDKNLNQQPKIATGNATQFKKAIKEGKAVVLPFRVEQSGENNQLGVDDQGFAGNLRRVTVTGDIVVRKNAAGVMESISNEKTLKCSCADYRNKYYCRHLNYAQRHMVNVAQQMLPEPGERGTTVVDTSPAGRLMTRTLAARNDVSVITPKDGSEPYISFGSSLPASGGRLVKTEYQSAVRSRSVIPTEYIPSDANNPDTQELAKLSEYNLRLQSISSISVPRSPSAIRTALKRSDVEVPIKASYYYRDYGRDGGLDNPMGNVSGTITYNKQADGNMENATVKSHTLKCSCEEYQEKYDCPHVRTTLDQKFVFLGAGGRDDAETATSSRTIMGRFNNAIQEDREIIAFMRRNPGLTREEAVARVEEIAEERIRERERVMELRRVQQQEYEERRERERLERLMTERERNASTIQAAEEYRERMMKRWENVEEGYTQNPETFFNDYKEALARKNKGDNALVFRTENVTDGICADEPGARQFGVELEFDIKPGVDRYDALAKIGKELHEAGLTNSPHQTHYHAAQNNGWAKWSFEEDCTVSGEIVSPIMKDTPEHWQELKTAVDIINRNGGVASTRTGSHVHISTASYENTDAKHIELLRQVNQNEDILYRLASNPATGKHRGTQWCAPNVSDSLADVDTESTGHYFDTSHGVGLNFESAKNPTFKKSNVEFRMWDGTLDAAVIQQQVALSAAITDAAEREVIKNGKSLKPTKSRIKIGAGKAIEEKALHDHVDSEAVKPKHNLDSFTESTADVSEFFDHIFRRKEDRAAATALFAVTNWQQEDQNSIRWS